MKKKFKLITTIASLCLAVALMAFGVYAATSVKYDVTTNVTFQAAQNVKAKVTYTLAVSNASGTTVSGNDKSATKAEGTYTIWEDALGNKADVENGVEKLGTIALAQAGEDKLDTDMIFTYTVTFHNNAVVTDGNKTLNITATYPVEKDVYATEGYKIEVTELTAATIGFADGSVGADVSYVIKLTVKPTASLPEGGVALNSHFELTMSK